MKKLFTLIAAVLLIVACSEDITTNRPDGNRRNISFGVLGDDAVSVTIDDNITRSTAISVLSNDFAPWTAELPEQQFTDVTEKVVEVESDFPTDEQLCLTITDEPRIHKDQITRGALQNMVDTRTLVFGVTEFIKDNTTSPVFSNRVPVVQNTTLDGGLELFLSKETWEDDAYNGTEYDFYAYAPQVANAGDKGITLSNNNRTISYDANDVEVGDQPDLMTARKATSAYVSLVPLTFQHRLCAIQIKTAGTWTAGYHVSGVQFTNVISSGTFDIDKDKDADWTNKGTAGIYTVKGFNKAAATATVVTGGSDKWLMLPPQTLSSAKISITLTDDATETYSYTVTAPISAYTWTAGHTVTYTISPASIATMTVNYPTSWNNGGTPVDGPVTTYETADEFGLFVLDRDNKILVSNQKVSPTTGVAAASRTLNIPSTIFKSKQYKYYLMYPYVSDATLQTIVNTSVATNYDNYYKKGATGRTTNANAFFTDVISNWTPAADQSAAADFKKQDLQIAVLSGNQFDMVHKMGLVEIELKTDTYYDIVESNGGTSTITQTATNKNATASSSFDNSGSYHVPMQSGSTNFYYAIVPTGAASTQFNSTSGTDQWTAAYTATGLSSGGFAHHDAYSTRVGTSFYSGSFSYSGNYLTFTVPFTGTYTIECWGAQGKWRNYQTNQAFGRGAYVKGDITLTKDEELYIFIGEQGHATNNSGTWNGGGFYVGGHASHGSGGASTDVRLTKTSATNVWKDFTSLKSRIIVAAGGAGSDDGGLWSVCCPHGGGVTGISNSYNSDQTTTNATQTNGGYWSYTSTQPNTHGHFGYGNIIQSNGYPYITGGGGGYYGGGGTDSGGIGGSSYISGHVGCIAVLESATESYDAEGNSLIAHRNDDNAIDRSTHYSGKKFTNTKMIDGAGYPWTDVQGTSYEQMPSCSSINAKYAAGMGHEGHGYCRITGTTVAP